MVPPPERGMGGNGAREERPHALYCGEGSRGPKARSERPPWPHLLSRQIPPRQITATSSKRGVDTELEERGGPVACTAGGATSIILALPHRTGCRCCSATTLACECESEAICPAASAQSSAGLIVVGWQAKPQARHGS